MIETRHGGFPVTLRLDRATWSGMPLARMDRLAQAVTV
jgi:hypothetical protein